MYLLFKSPPIAAPDPSRCCRLDLAALAPCGFAAGWFDRPESDVY